jgi:hypothetical protein
MKSICPICKTALQTEDNQLPAGDYEAFDCPRCGKYKVSRTLLKAIPDLLKDKENVILLSYTVRKMQGGQEMPFLNSYSVETILKNKLPSLSDQMNNLILWVGDNSDPGQKLVKDIETIQTIIGAKKLDGALFVIQHLNRSLIDLSGAPTVPQIQLTVSGWEYYDKLKRGAIMSRRAFMAMKYGDEDLEWMFENCFKRAVKATGFDLYRLDKDPKAGLIDDQLRVEIRTSRFLIADLTHDNEGAYWESGFAEGLGKPVIYICEKQKFEKDKTHFDTNHQKTFTWERENPEEIFEQLKATIRATLPEEAILTDTQ